MRNLAIVIIIIVKIRVLNNDDAVTAEYMRSTAATVVTYGIDTTSDVMAKDIVMTSGGTTFTLVTPYESVNVTMKLIGKFNVYNVLAATAAGLVSGVSLETIIDVIKELAGVPGRFEVVDGGQNYTVIVDYAHTPDSLENVLKQQNSLQKVTYIASSVVAVIEIERRDQSWQVLQHDMQLTPFTLQIIQEVKSQELF